MLQYMTMTSSMTLQADQKLRVAQLQTQQGQGVGRQLNNCGHGRGCGGCVRGCGQGRRGRRSQGRSSRGYNPYSLSREGYDSFVLEGRRYLLEEWDFLLYQQREAVIKAKNNSGWWNGYNPLEGFVLDHTGRPTLSMLLVTAVQSIIGQVSQSHDSGMTTNIPPPPAVPLPPPPPPVIDTRNNISPAQDGLVFERTAIIEVTHSALVK